MPTTRAPPTIPDDPAERDPHHYVMMGSERYTEWIRDMLGIEPTPEQQELNRLAAENKYTYIQGANGFGKTFGVDTLSLAFLYIHNPISIVVTSGTYKKLKRTFCDTAEDLLNTLQARTPGYPGEFKWSPNPHIDIDGHPLWQYEVDSPEEAGELEGVHNTHTLAIIEEADKKDVTGDVIDSMSSLVTDDRDRIVIIANPPEDETNSLCTEVIGNDQYVERRFSSFDSHNVKVETGQRDGELIDGLATLGKIRDDWDAWNDEPWPGWEAASTRRDDTLSTRWWRRRLGEIPPGGAAAWRPVELGPVQRAYTPALPAPTPRSPPVGVGIDVARKHDRTVLSAVYDTPEPAIHVHYKETGTDHTAQEARLRGLLDDWPADTPVAIDATGSGEGLADRLNQAYPDVHRFQNGAAAAADTTYYDCWTEGLCLLGEWLEAGGHFGDTHLREELLACARTITLSTRYLSSRGTGPEKGADVIDSSKKEQITDAVGHSPDCLDSSLMAVWAAEAEPTTSEGFIVSSVG